MKILLRILAILALVVTIAGAGVVLYALETRIPGVEVVYAMHESANDDSEAYDAFVTAVSDGTYGGRVFDEAVPERESCTFLKCTLRMQNRCLLPMEWIEIAVEPGEGDILESRDENPHVLTARTSGDLSLQVMTRADAFPQERTVSITYYLLGRLMKAAVRVIWN